MRIDRRWTVLALMSWMALSLVTARADAGAIVGANFGVSILIPEESEDELVTIAIPGQSGTLAPGLIPGLRIGGRSGEGVHEAYVDVAFSLWSVSSTTITNTIVTANYQANLAPRSAVCPYVTLGGGLVNVSYEGDSESTSLVGVGVGLRRTLDNGHGAVRFEARGDHLFGNDEEFLEFLEGNALAFKVGFDLFIN